MPTTHKFGKKKGQREAFLKALAHSLIMRERIETTDVRAKALRPFIERMITTGKKQQVVSLRRLMAKLPKDSAYKLYHTIAPRYQDRAGGYTRIIKSAKTRKRDSAPVSVIEFV